MNRSLHPPSPWAPPRRDFTSPSLFSEQGGGTSVLVTKSPKNEIFVSSSFNLVAKLSSLLPISHPALLLIAAAVIILNLHKCSQCDFASIRPDNLKRHRRTHSVVKVMATIPLSSFSTEGSSMPG